MKILILGATGMLGHKILQKFKNNFTVTGTIRSEFKKESDHPLGKMNIINNVYADDFRTIERAIEETYPDVIVNAIGIVKQLPQASDPVVSISINSLFPHLLAECCEKQDIRLIHYSTDCVFSGSKGNYSEEDFPDANDLYGRSKLLGEVTGHKCLTLRTSIIGRELSGSHGLIEWFLSQKGKTIKGYKNAIFSGLTTNAHARILKEIILDYPNLEGLYHLASDPISKYDLLTLVKKQYNMDINIEPDYHEVSDRSLNSSKLRLETNIVTPSWDEMVKEMFEDPTPYDLFRSHHANQ